VNKKGISTLLIVAIVVVVVVIAGIAVYVLYSGTGGENGGNGNGGEDVYTVENATSLQYDADVTTQGQTFTYKLAGKNLGTENMKLRIDLLGGETGNYSYILNAGDETAWAAVNGEWTDMTTDFAAQWQAWGTEWTNYINNLKNWSGTGEYTYTAEGVSVRVYNISLNPSLADSLFQPPA
jgi:hypothetical protein